jgi:transposase
VRRAPPVQLRRDERRTLTDLLRDRSTSTRLRVRVRIVLRAAEGIENQRIASELRIDPGTVALWRRRFLALRVPGLVQDAPRPGRPPAIPTSTIRSIVRASRRPPPLGAPDWSARRLAEASGVSKTTVQRIWKAHGIHLRRPEPAPAVASVPSFVEKITDVVGLYLDPPDRAMAFAVDPWSKGGTRLPAPERRTIARTPERDRAGEFRRFLQAIDRETAPGLELHLLISNLYAPATPQVGRWLVRHPRVHLHFVPAGPSGTSLIGSLLGGFSRKRIGSTTLPSVARLLRAVRAHAAFPADASSPVVWVASRGEIRDRLGRSGEHVEFVDRRLRRFARSDEARPGP